MNPGYRDDPQNDPHPDLGGTGLASEHPRNGTKAINGVFDDGTRTPALSVCVCVCVCTPFQQS